jgi:hypothetical protein
MGCRDNLDRLTKRNFLCTAYWSFIHRHMDGYNKSSHFHKSCPFSKPMIFFNVGSISNQTRANWPRVRTPLGKWITVQFFCFTVSCNVPGITSELTAWSFGVFVVVLCKRFVYLHAVYMYNDSIQVAHYTASNITVTNEQYTEKNV